MPVDRLRPRAYVGAAGASCFALAVVAVALVARDSTLEGIAFSALWPAGGLPVLWLLVRGARLVSVDTVLLAGSLVAANLVAGADLELAAAFGLANLVQTWLAVLLLRRWCPRLWGCGGETPLDRPRTVAMLGSALIAAIAVGTAIGTVAASLLPEHVPGGFDTVDVALWFGRNLCAALIVLGFGLELGQRLTSPGPRPSLLADGGAAELVAAVAYTVGMYVLVFSFDDLPLTFPLIAASAWVAARFSTMVGVTHSLLVGLATMALTLQGVGPFASLDDVALGYLLAQLYVITIALTGLAIATGRDERVALADALRRTREEAVYQEQLRSAVIGSMTEGVLVVDDTGDLLVQNDAAARALGVSSALTGALVAGIAATQLDGTPVTHELQPSCRALAGEAVYEQNLLIRAEDGTERVLTISAIPLPRDDLHGRARALMLLRDSTTDHAHREELAAFAGVVAHDLRNPLAAIDGWTEMIADELDAGALDAQLAREFVSRVRSASRRMRELIRDLLAHATSSARDLDASRVEIPVLVGEIAAGRHAEGQVSAEEVPAVLGDPVLVRQVLDNLIGNALKYVAPGEQAKISVRGARTDARWVTVQVADNGIGVPEEDRERIFEEFHRAHYREYEGSGLGLSIVRRIVNRHGGTIVALPNPEGHGSLFEFTLPAYDA